MNTTESAAVLTLSKLPVATDLASELHDATQRAALAAMPVKLLNLAHLCRAGAARSQGLAAIAIRASERGEASLEEVEFMATLAEDLCQLFATIAGETHEIASQA